MDFILMDVCRTGDVDRLNAAISEGVVVNQRGTAGETLLHWAAEGGQIEIIKVLLQQPNLNVNTTDSELATPLHWSCQENHHECSAFLLSIGASINAKNITGDTPLHLACFEGGLDCVNLLIGKGADVNIQDEAGYTPLHAAILNARKECAQSLIDKGANYNLTDKTSKSARQLAYETGLFNKFDFLFETRQDVIDMFMGSLKENEALQQQNTALKEEIHRLKGFLGQENESFVKNRESLQAVHHTVSGIEKLLQECLLSATDTKNKLQIQIQ